MRTTSVQRKQVEERHSRHLVSGPKARAESKASEQSLHELVEELGVIIWEAAPPALQFSLVSRPAGPSWASAWRNGFKDPFNHIPSEDRERIAALWRVVLSEGRDHDVECRTLAAYGRQIWLRNIVRVIRDGKGAALKLLGLIVDTTQRRRADVLAMRTVGAGQQITHPAISHSLQFL